MPEMEKTILVVDDERGFHDLFRFVLEPLGFSVCSAYDGLEGLTLIREHDYDIVFLDIHMPGLDGARLAEMIGRLKPAQFVVLMSSGSDPQRICERLARGVGLMSCLLKPFEIDAVIRSVERISKVVGRNGKNDTYS